MKSAIPLAAIVVSVAALVGCNEDQKATPTAESKPASSPSAYTAPAPAKESPVSNHEAPRRVDDTGQNEVDRSGMSMLPTDQGNSEADIRITAEIRKALVGDAALSMNAQNIKIITSNGVVVLRGPVASAAEADQVLVLTRTVNGVTKVENQLAVP